MALNNRRASNLQEFRVQPVQKITSFTITHLDDDKTFHNQGATGLITLILPQAVPGHRVSILVATAQFITVSPNEVGPDTIRGKAAGATVSSNTVGNYIRLECVIAGFWEPVINIGPFA